ncbi:TPA: serine hydrolase [Legionella pneumophila]
MAPQTRTSWANTAGAMVSTSHDMAIWFKNLLDGSLFPPKQMNELLTFVDGIFPDTSIQIGYGLGIIHDFDTFGEEALWHSGGTLGYNALMVWLKCNDVVITTNINHTTVNRDMYNITRDLATFIQKEDTSNICKVNFSEKGSEIPRKLKEYVDKASFAGINIL